MNEAELTKKYARLRILMSRLLNGIHWDAFAEDDTTLEIDREIAESVKEEYE